MFIPQGGNLQCGSFQPAQAATGGCGTRNDSLDWPGIEPAPPLWQVRILPLLYIHNIKTQVLSVKKFNREQIKLLHKRCCVYCRTQLEPGTDSRNGSFEEDAADVPSPTGLIRLPHFNTHTHTLCQGHVCVCVCVIVIYSTLQTVFTKQILQ